MPLAGGQGGHLGVQLTLSNQGRRTNYAHHITACSPGFENLTASLLGDPDFSKSVNPSAQNFWFFSPLALVLSRSSCQ